MYCIFFFNHTATTEIYTLSLHDALPISVPDENMEAFVAQVVGYTAPDDAETDYSNILFRATGHVKECWRDRKSTRLNSSHSQISYAVFCLKKKKKKKKHYYT